MASVAYWAQGEEEVRSRDPMGRGIKRLIIWGVISGVIHLAVLCAPISYTPGIVSVRGASGPLEVSLVAIQQGESTPTLRAVQSEEEILIPPWYRVEALTSETPAKEQVRTETLIGWASGSSEGGAPVRRGDSISAVPLYVGPKPLYPLVARQRGYEGTVRLEVAVLPSGRVGTIRVRESSGYEVLDRSALNTVKGWHFFPDTDGGLSVESTVIVPITFRIEVRR